MLKKTSSEEDRIWVLLQAPNDGYYWILKATSEKHFSLIDSGWYEIDSGDWEQMIELMQNYEDTYLDQIINLICLDNYSLVQTSYECLVEILDRDPSFLDNKTFQ